MSIWRLLQPDYRDREGRYQKSEWCKNTTMKTQLCSALLVTLWLSGCQAPRSTPPANAPLIGEAKLSRQEKGSNYGVIIPLCNRGPEKMKAKVFIGGAPKDLIHAPRTSGLWAGSGAWAWTQLCEIREKRTRPVYIRIEWRRGKERGTKQIVISPEQTDVIKII
jgi:hypothetical protein